jgi:ABC-type multidrug transport system fused ATPase/permease subunit
MESSIHRFVLRHAPRETAWVIVLTLASLPLYYLSLDIPKNIMNQAILAKGMVWPTSFFGLSLDQVAFLFVLSGLFLASVLVNGGLKQYINTLKGRLGERLLRRLRYELIDRVMRFPLPHFRKVSAGEVIPMVTAEVESIGGYMGDAFAQPLIQLGTLGTIVVFLFIQNWKMGLAAVSLYPLQAFVIPKLQRRINLLGKDRVRAVRRMSERIGESVSGIQEIRVHGTVNYERSHYSSQLGRIFKIRFEIYQRKAFVKFLNNFLNQIPPLFFYSIGGYLVIQGELTLGALAAALTAHKDMSSPWKELLDWYQQTQDAKIKYEQVVEQFRPAGMMDKALQAPQTLPLPMLDGPLVLANVSLNDDTGLKLLEGVSASFAAGEHVGLVGPAAGGRDALVQLIGRLQLPSTGRLTIGERDLAQISEITLGARMSYVASNPYLFSASVRDNLVYGLRQVVVATAADPAQERQRQKRIAESRRAGNAEHEPEDQWTDLMRGGVSDQQALDTRLMRILERVDMAEEIYQLGLRGRVDPTQRPETATLILAARRAVAARLEQSDWRALVEPFAADRYNANASLAENLLFGTPTDAAYEVDSLASNAAVLDVLTRVGLTPLLLDAGRTVAQTMVEIFADLPPGHALFEQYSFLSAEELAELPALLGRVGMDPATASDGDRARLLTLPFKLVEARHRLGTIDDRLKALVIRARAQLRVTIKTGIAYFDRERYNAAATIQDNILFGKVAYGQARADARAAKLIGETLDEQGLRSAVMAVGLDHQVGVGGARLSAPQRVKLALARALVKRPEFLIINEATTVLDAATQQRVLDGVLAESMGRTVMWSLQSAPLARRFTRVLVFAEGRLVESGEPPELEKNGSAFAQLIRAAD